jgi:hypothetical protein
LIFQVDFSNWAEIRSPQINGLQRKIQREYAWFGAYTAILRSGAGLALDVIPDGRRRNAAHFLLLLLPRNLVVAPTDHLLDHIGVVVARRRRIVVDAEGMYFFMNST